MIKFFIVVAKIVAFLVAATSLLALGIFPYVEYLKRQSGLEEIEFDALTRAPTEVLAAVGTLLVLAVFAWLWDRRPLSDFGVRARGLLRHTALGTLAGIGVGVVGITLALALGWAEVSSDAVFLPVTTIAIMGGGLLLNSFAQEAMFRGYTLNVLDHAYGPWIAVLASSALFVLIHAPVFTLPTNEMVVGVANLFIAGVMLALAFKVTGSLWLATGIHFGWNLSQGFISSGVTNTALAGETALINYTGTMPFFDSGNFEVNALGLIGPVLLLVIFAAKLIGRRSTTSA